MNTPSNPTGDFYTSLHRAFGHFNSQLFEGKLTPVLITLLSSGHHHGYHQRPLPEHLTSFGPPFLGLDFMEEGVLFRP